MDRRYKHLNGEERGVILAEHRRGASLRAIGLALGRSASTIGRELRRGRPEGEPALPYCAQRGGADYRARRKRCGRRHKLVAGGWLHDFVRGKLIHRRWSPEQIACKLRAMHPEDPSGRISPETIYAAICAQPRGGLKAEMIAALRQHKPARGLRRTTLAGSSIAPESLRIIHRPEEIEARFRARHNVALRRLVFAATLACISTAAGYPVMAAPDAPMIVTNDRGGLLGQRSAEIRALRSSGQRVELRGTCLSACTMYLGLANVCVSPSAPFGFHGPTRNGKRLS